jgi:hypothetical protein
MKKANNGGAGRQGQFRWNTVEGGIITLYIRGTVFDSLARKRLTHEYN